MRRLTPREREVLPLVVGGLLEQAGRRRARHHVRSPCKLHRQRRNAERWPPRRWRISSASRSDWKYPVTRSRARRGGFERDGKEDLSWRLSMTI